METRTKQNLEDFIKDVYEQEYVAVIDILCALLKGEEIKYTEDLPKILRMSEQHIREEYGQAQEMDYLLSGLYRNYRVYQTSSEMILLLKSLWFFKDNPEKNELRHLFVQYLRRKNRFYSGIMQENQIQGLANFRMYYGEMTKRMAIMSQTEGCGLIFKSFSSNIHLRKLEVRISPDMRILDSGIQKGQLEYEQVRYEMKADILKRVRIVLDAYRKNLLETAGIYDWKLGMQVDFSTLDCQCREGKSAGPSIGIIFHFNKRNYVDNRVGSMCWVRDAEKAAIYSKHIIMWRSVMTAQATAIEELRSQIPLLGRYVVGIDAASEENQAEPWIFAPVYNAIRNRSITRPVIEDMDGKIERLNNIGFTYHVGEEFRHLLSGLRHIDEVIEHFHYKPGDRLGHAVALGVDVEYWMRRNAVVIVPVMEHLENLLWLWGNMVYENWVIGIAVEALEGKILNLAKMIYGDISGMEVHILYDAYSEKFNLNYERIFVKIKEKYILDEPREENVSANGLHHFCRYYNTSSPFGVLWTKEKIFCTFFCPLYFRRFQKPIFINVDNEEFQMLKKVQEYVIQKVEQKGIYVEVNPTSNTTIGDIEALFSNYILNLNSKGLDNSHGKKHEVLVTVNSDDPLIFNTNCENELAYLYHCLVHKNYKKESILQWIDKVRQAGIDSSFVKKEVLPSVQYKEITQTLECIDDFLKLKR